MVESPTPIPGDLVEGDRLVLSASYGEAVVKNIEGRDTPYWEDGAVTANPDNPRISTHNVYRKNGFHDSYHHNFHDLFVVGIIRARAVRKNSMFLTNAKGARHG